MNDAYVQGFMDKCAASGFDLNDLKHRIRRIFSPAEEEHGVRNKVVPYIGASAAQSLTALPVLGMATAPVARGKDKHIADVLERFVRRRGITTGSFDDVVRASLGGRPLTEAEAMQVKIMKNLTGAGLGSYAPKLKRIVTSNRNPGIMAHEVGHVLQPSSNPKFVDAMSALRQGGSLAGLAPLFTRNEDTANRLAAFGSIATLPMLGQELSASMRGAKLLKRLKGSPIKAFSGIPTYAAMTAVPWLIKSIRKQMGGYDQ